jgi:nucleoside-diphosphate-sugar epimerase
MHVIAITGASSFIGTHLVKHLAHCNDFQLRLLVNRNLNLSVPESTNVSIMQGNLLNHETLNGFLDTGCTVINLAYLNGHSPEENLEATENLVKACIRAKIKRLIHCSTATVSGRVSTDRVIENTPDNPLNEYEVTKSRIEKLLIEKSDGLFETIILRPTAVFGKGGKNLVKLADSLMCGNQFVNYLKSCLYQFRRMNLVYIDNVVSAIEFFIRTDRNTHGEAFIISDDEDPSNNYRDIETYLMKRIGCKAYPVAPVSLPFPILRSLLRLAGKSNDNPDLVYDCEKILSSGFKKPLSFKEGLSRFSDWYIKTHYPDKHHI